MHRLPDHNDNALRRRCWLSLPSPPEQTQPAEAGGEEEAELSGQAPKTVALGSRPPREVHSVDVEIRLRIVEAVYAPSSPHGDHSL